MVYLPLLIKYCILFISFFYKIKCIINYYYIINENMFNNSNKLYNQLNIYYYKGYLQVQLVNGVQQEFVYSIHHFSNP